MPNPRCHRAISARYELAVLPHEGEFAIMYGSTTFPVGSGYRFGYLSRPDQVGRFPVVVVVPRLTGLGSHEKDICRRLARRGLAALAVEVYRPGSTDPHLAYQAMADGEAIWVLEEVYEYLQSEDIDWAIQGAVGVLGIDVGGRFALMLASSRAWVRAAALAYTPLTGDEEREKPVASVLSHLAVPILGLYGAGDDLIATDTVDEAQRRNPAGQWLLYENVGHDFLDDGSPNFDASAAGDALIRLTQFFTANLPQAQVEVVG